MGGGVAFLATLFLIFGLIQLAGCQRPPTSVNDANSKAAAHQKTDPWKDAERKLKVGTEYGTCHSALQAVNETLRNDETLPRPTGLTPEAERALSATVPLNPGDLDEIRKWSYSPHDAAYLADCLYLRDVAQIIRITNIPPEKLADLGFAWVCRSVTLEPWLLGDRNDRIAAALPPTAVLRRGSGSALERMYVFLALLQQFGLDGCLVGPENAGMVMTSSALEGGPERKPLPGGPAKPFWAVGVRIGSEVKLYDPWRGAAFPAYWNAFKANPDAHKPWFGDASNKSRLKPEDLKDARLHLAVPVNAISPRMEMLDQKLKDVLDVRLAVNPTALRAAFPDPKPAFWNPPQDRFAYGRTARLFLPREMGGMDESPPRARLYDRYIESQYPNEKVLSDQFDRFQKTYPGVPINEFKFVKEGLVRSTLGNFDDAFIGSANLRDTRDSRPRPPQPREQIQRGRFNDARSYLVKKQEQFILEQSRLRTASSSATVLRGWFTQFRALDASLGGPDGALANQGIMRLWQEGSMPDGAVVLMLSGIAAPLYEAEAAFLLALCKHEVAEEKQTRLEYAPLTGDDAKALKKDADEAWGDARSAWQSYAESSAAIQADIPGRKEQVKAFLERADKLAPQ
jgi:hypothetical protein